MSARETLLVEVGTHTNDPHGRTAGEVAAVTTLGGVVLANLAGYKAKNFDGKGTIMEYPEGASDIVRTHRSSSRLLDTINQAAVQVNAATVSATRATTAALSYEELLASLLSDQEDMVGGFFLCFNEVRMFARETVAAP